MGVEAGGEGIETGRHGASLGHGQPGVLHGMYSYLLQDPDGQVVEPHSISAGLDYPGVGPEHSFLRDTGRVRYVSATDAEALAAFQACSRAEGIIPALESSHALALLAREGAGARSRRTGARVPVGARRQGRRRGRASRWASMTEGGARIRAAFARRRPAPLHAVRHGRLSRPSTRAPSTLATAARHADLIELGIPFSDPLADGPTIQAAGQRALESGTHPADVIELAESRPRRAAGGADDLRQHRPRRGAAGVHGARRAGRRRRGDPPGPADRRGRGRARPGAPRRRLGDPARRAHQRRRPPRRRSAGRADGFVYCVAVTGVTGGEVRGGRRAARLPRARPRAHRRPARRRLRHPHPRARRGDRRASPTA